MPIEAPKSGPMGWDKRERVSLAWGPFTWRGGQKNPPRALFVAGVLAYRTQASMWGGFPPASVLHRGFVVQQSERAASVPSVAGVPHTDAAAIVRPALILDDDARVGEIDDR